MVSTELARTIPRDFEPRRLADDADIQRAKCLLRRLMDDPTTDEFYIFMDDLWNERHFAPEIRHANLFPYWPSRAPVMLELIAEWYAANGLRMPE